MERLTISFIAAPKMEDKPVREECASTIRTALQNILVIGLGSFLIVCLDILIPSEHVGEALWRLRNALPFMNWF
jgi:hypothetical protein